MRCSATVENKHALSYRATPSTDNQCRREAKVGTLCRQHALVRHCQERDCDRRAVEQHQDWAGCWWWFCRKHSGPRAEHNRIVQRILDIPAR